MNTFKQFYEGHPEAFHGQTYSDNSGEYKVEDLDVYAKEHHPEVKSVPIDKLDHMFDSDPEESFDEVPGSPEFVNRAGMADFKHPILIVRYKDEDPQLWVADGSHRLWKAREEGMNNIDAYIIPSEELESLRI